MSELQRYAAEQESAITHGIKRGPATEAWRKVTPFGVRSWAKLNLTTAMTPLSARKAKNIAAPPGGLRLQLGSGMNNLDGWINLDLVGMDADLVWDIRRELPFPPGSADVLVLEHVLEHFSLVDGLALLRRCARALAPGGTIRVWRSELRCLRDQLRRRSRVHRGTAAGSADAAARGGRGRTQARPSICLGRLRP